MKAKNTESWVEYLNQAELPVLAHTLRQIQEITQSQTSSIQDLAEVILRDAELTSKVLKAANTVYYNPGGQVISTVSRAISLTGFDTIKSITMAAVVIDNLFQRKPVTSQLKCMAFALHGAVQSRQLLGKIEPLKREEIFIAALLAGIGELAFWSCRTPYVAQLQEAMEHSEPVVAQRNVLGTTFSEITHKLIESWHLGALLRTVVSFKCPDKGLPAQIKTICALVRHSETGWESPQSERNRSLLCTQLSADPQTLFDQLQDNAAKTAELARAYKLEAILPYLPLKENQRKSDPALAPAGDSALQLQILRDLASYLSEKPSLNGVLQIIAEGLHRGVGLQRVAVLLMSQKENRHLPRIVMGSQTDHWKTTFIVPATGPGLLNAVLKEAGTTFFNGNRDLVWQKFEKPSFDPWIGNREGLATPIHLGNRCIGLIYADQGDTTWSISLEQRQGFAHFTLQARLCLMHLSEYSG